MNSNSMFPIRSCINLLLFYVVTALICFATGHGLVSLGIFNPQFATTDTSYVIGYILLGVWTMFLALSFVEHISSLTGPVFILCLSLVSIPIAIILFVFFATQANIFELSGSSFVRQLTAITFISSVLALICGYFFIRIVELADNRMYKLYRMLGF